MKVENLGLQILIATLLVKKLSKLRNFLQIRRKPSLKITFMLCNFVIKNSQKSVFKQMLMSLCSVYVCNTNEKNTPWFHIPLTKVAKLKNSYTVKC